MILVVRMSWPEVEELVADRARQLLDLGDMRLRCVGRCGDDGLEIRFESKEEPEQCSS